MNLVGKGSREEVHDSVIVRVQFTQLQRASASLGFRGVEHPLIKPEEEIPTLPGAPIWKADAPGKRIAQPAAELLYSLIGWLSRQRRIIQCRREFFRRLKGYAIHIGVAVQPSKGSPQCSNAQAAEPLPAVPYTMCTSRNTEDCLR